MTTKMQKMTMNPEDTTKAVAPLQSLIGGRILDLRDQRVMLDADLAELYDVQTKLLVQAVTRRSQTVTSNGFVSPQETRKSS